MRRDLDAKQLREVIETYLAYAGSKEVFIFLDEITDVNGWEKVIKDSLTTGVGKAVVTVSGSNAFQLQKEANCFQAGAGME